MIDVHTYFYIHPVILSMDMFRELYNKQLEIQQTKLVQNLLGSLRTYVFT